MSHTSRRRLLRSAALIAALSVGTLANTALAAERSYNFDIPAESLSKALRDYGRATRQQLVFTEDLTAGKTAAEVRGTLTAGDALDKILDGSGLTVERTSTGALVIQKARPTSADPELQPQSLEEVIVTANKREEGLSKIGAGISVVTSEQLDTLAANSLQDFLQLIPGVSLQSYGAPGFGSVAIRGVSPQSVGATTATYIDNIPYGGSSALSEGGGFTPDIDPADIQRVEVLKGPQGTLYGASSLGGVIKYVTKQPSLERTEVNTSEEANYTAHGEPGGKVRASYSTPLIDDKLAVRVSGYYRWIGGYVDDVGLGGKDVNSGTDWGLHAAVLYKPTNDLTISLNALTQQVQANGLNTVDLNPSTGKPLYGDLSQRRYTPERFQTKTTLVSSEINWQTPYGTFLSATSFSQIKPANIQDLTVRLAPLGLGVSPSAPAGGVGHHTDEQETQELRFTSNRLGNLEFIAGGFFQHEFLTDGPAYVSYDTSGNVKPNGSLGIDNKKGTLDEAAGFINATYYILPQLDVTLGYRHSQIDQTRSEFRGGRLFGSPTTFTSTSQAFSEGSDTYLAGVRWRAADGIMFYARAASGYRPGGGRTVPPGAPTGFAPTFTSDSIWSYEAGVKLRTLGNRLSVDADGFWIDWSNIQSLVAVGRFHTDGNGGAARSRGLELQAAYVPFKGLTLSGNATYTDATFTQTVNTFTAGERLFFVPKLTASVSAEYSFPLFGSWTGNVGGDLSYTSSVLDVTNHTLPPYGILNLHAGASQGNYTVNVYIKNAADRRAYVGDAGYFPGSPPFTVTVYQPLTVGVVFSQRF